MTPTTPPTIRLKPLHAIDRRIIEHAVARWPDRKPEIARALGISLKTLYNRINQYGARSRAS